MTMFSARCGSRAERALTMGVSSRQSCANSVRNSARNAGGARGYADANVLHADTLDVNHSPVASRCESASLSGK